MAQRLIMFTGRECAHCREMYPLVERLENETGLKIGQLEVWHNAENAAFLKSIDKNPDGSVFCGGVPLFYSEKTGRKLCGNQKYEKLREWALGQGD